MIFDTDVFIWIQRGNAKAAALVDGADERYLALQTHLELLQGARNKREQQLTHDFLHDNAFVTLPLSESIGHRALIYIEEYGLASGLRAGDALIAATAVEHHLMLATSNAKHFRAINDLALRVLKP